MKVPLRTSCASKTWSATARRASALELHVIVKIMPSFDVRDGLWRSMGRKEKEERKSAHTLVCGEWLSLAPASLLLTPAPCARNQRKVVMLFGLHAMMQRS